MTGAPQPAPETFVTQPPLHAVRGGFPETSLQAFLNPRDGAEIEGNVPDSPGLELPQSCWV